MVRRARLGAGAAAFGGILAGRRVSAGIARGLAGKPPSGLMLFNALLIVRWVSLAVASFGFAWNQVSHGNQPYGAFVPVVSLCVLYTLVMTLFAPQIYEANMRGLGFIAIDYLVTFVALTFTGTVWTPMLVFAGGSALFVGVRGKLRDALVASCAVVLVYLVSLAAKGLTLADLTANEGADLAIAYSLEFLVFPWIWAYSARTLQKVHAGYRDVEKAHDALANANENLEARGVQLRVLQRIRSAILATGDVEVVLGIVREELAKVGFVHTTVWLLDGDELVARPREDYLSSLRADGDDPIPLALRTGRASTLRPGQATDTRTAGGYAAVVPVSGERSMLGVVVAERGDDEPLPDVAIESVRLFAEELALALSHMEASERAREYAVSEERNRIAAGIHRTVVHDLQEADTMATAASAQLTVPHDIERIGLLRETLAGCLRDLRFAVLNWTSLEWGTGIAALTQRYAREFTELSGISVDLLTRGEECPLAPATARDLLRVLQESLTNVWRHAATRAVRVDLEFDAEGATLTVKDEGAGCDPVAAEDGRGIGLKSIRRRSERHGGTMSFASAPSEGTVLKVWLPC